MPITDPFDVIRSRGTQTADPDDQPDDGSSSIPEDAPTPFSMALQQMRQRAPQDLAYAQRQQAAQDAAAQKAQEAQNKIDAENQAAQDRADAENLKANGAVTQAAVAAGPDGRARVIQQQQTNPDGTPAYKPADLGIMPGPDGKPFSVSRTQWGTQQWNDPYAPANANLKLNPTGQIMATPKGKGAEALPQQDVSTQGVTGLGAVDAQGNPDPSQLKVDPNAPINQPQVVSQINSEEQKLVQQAAAQRVKDTVGKDADDAAQALADARGDHTDAQAALAEAKANAKDGSNPDFGDKANAALAAAQQLADQKRDALIAAGHDAAAKRNLHQQAQADPVGFLQQQSLGQSQPPAPAPAAQPVSGTGQPSGSAASAPPGATAQPSSNPPAAGAVPDPTQSASATPTDPNSIAGLITGTYGQQQGSQPTVDAQGNPVPTGPAQKGTWGSWLSNVKTKSVALFGSAIGDIMKGVGGATDLVDPGKSLGLNKLLAPVAQSLMSPANFQKWQDQVNAPNPITAAGNQIKANADALASGSVGLQLPNLGSLKGPTLQVDPNRKDLGTNIISGAAGMAPMLAGGEFETPLWMNSGYQNAVDESKKNGDSPMVTQAKGIVGAVTMGGVSKLFNAFGAPASKFFNPVLWGSREAADGTTNPILKVLQGGATATTANVLAQIAKLAGKGGIEGAGFSVGGQVAAGDNPYAPADASKNTSDDLSSAGSLAALQAVLGTFTHGKTLHQISKGVDDLVSQTNDARTNPPDGQPPQPPLDRATVLAGLIHQNQVARAQDSFSKLQTQYQTLDSNDALTPQQRLGEKMKAVAQVPAELRAAVVAHLDAAAEAQRQTDEAMKTADAEQAKIPPTTPDLGRRSDAYIQANQQDILQSQQTGQPRQRQLIGTETDADIMAEAARRQKLADLSNQRSQVVAGIAGNLKDSLDQTVSLAGTPEGRSALLSLNRYNASQPAGAPKASATTLQNAMDLAPRPAGDLSLPSVYVEHYLPLAHQIEQLGDPDQKVMATAATKLTNGRALTDDERTLLLGSPDGSLPAAVTPDGQPFAKVEGHRPILTDAGLARLKTLVPAASEVLPRSEQTQLEAQPPPLPKGAKAPAQPPPLNNSIASHLSGVDLSKPDPALANIDDETLQVQHGNVTAAIAKARANGGDSPPTVYAHRDRLATEMARRAAAIQPVESNPLGAPAGAKEGDEIDYTRPTREGQTVQTRGEVIHVGPDHYRVVDAHDGVERTVPISRNAPEPARVPEAKSGARSNGHPQQTLGREPEKDSAIRLPGIDTAQIAPAHLEAARLLSGIYGKVQAAAERLGIDGFSPHSSPEGFIGLAVHPGDLTKIQLDLPRLAQNLAKLRTPAERAARVEEVVDEELRHVALETVAGEDNGSHSTAKADTTFSKIWASASKFQKRTVLDLYQKGALAFVDPDRAAKNSTASLENASDANKGREYLRMLSQLQARGRTSEIADLLTPETKTFFQKVVAYLRHVFMRLNDPVGKQLLDQTEQLLRMHPEDAGEDNLDMSPPKDLSPANGNDHPADIAMSNGETLPARYELAELASLSPSHRNGSPNPDYPHGLNERDYSLPEEKQKNEAMASNFDPRRVITDNPDSVNGPPIVDKKGIVLGGNRRTIMLSDPRAYAKYKPYLQANAERFGLKPEDVAKMQQPVLVRRVDTPEEQRPELIRRLNEVPTGGVDAANDAVSAGKQITPELVRTVSDLFQQDPDKTPLQHLSDGDTKSIAQGLLDAGAIRPNDKEKYISANGNLTPEGARFARSVLLGGVLPDAQLLREISDTPTETKLLNGLSPLYTMKARGADIAPLREAVALEADRQRLGIKSASEFQSQGNLAGIGQEASTEGKTMQSFLAGIKGNEARRAFTQLQNLVSPLEPGQSSLFGEKNRASISEVTDAEMNKVIKSSKRITKAADKLREVVGSGGVAEKPVSYPGPLPMPGMPPGALTPEQRAVEAKFAHWVQQDPDRAARAYAALPETEGGRVIDMDEARKLSPDYSASKRAKTINSVSVQKVVNALAIKKLLSTAIKDLQPGDTVGLTAGGPGSGKGNIKRVLPGEWYGAKFVYDGVLRNLEDANTYLKGATDRGAKARIWYVHVPVEKAVDQAVGRAEHDGRSLPLSVLASGHLDAQRTIIDLLRQHIDNPDVEIKVVDNSGQTPRVVENPLSFLQDGRNLYRDLDEVTNRANQAFARHGSRLADPIARQIFETGTFQAGDGQGTGRGFGSSVSQRERSGGSDGQSGTPDRSVAGAAVREPASVPSADDPRREMALKAYRVLTDLQAEGKTLSPSQQETLGRAGRILSGGREGDEGLTSPSETERQSNQARRDSEPAASSGSPQAGADLIGRGAEASAGASRGQPGSGTAGTATSRQSALKAYNTLTAWKAEGRKLTVGQEQTLENAERLLGQQFLPGTEETRQPDTQHPEPSEPVNLRTTRAGRVVHQSLFDMGRDVAHGQSLLFGSAVADRPEMERPLARYVAALQQGELNIGHPSELDFSREYQTDMGHPAPAPLVARAKELEVQPGEADQAGGRTPAELFHNHLDVADRLAASFDNIPGFQPDDARQVARVALQKAAENYDVDQGVPFRGYAPRIIRNALRDAYRFQVRRAVEQPTLDRPVDTGKSDVTGKDLVPAKEPTASEAAARNDAHAQLRHYIDQAPMLSSSRGVLRGLLEGKSQNEMAAELGVSPQRVSAMVGTGLEQLRKIFAEKGIVRSDLIGGAAIAGLPDTAPPSARSNAAKLWAEKGVQSPLFKRWFGDWEKNPAQASKIVDTQGKPQVVFHHGQPNIQAFDLDHLRPADSGPAGFYFSPDKEAFSGFKKGATYQAYLDIRNPVRPDTMATAGDIRYIMGRLGAPAKEWRDHLRGIAYQKQGAKENLKSLEGAPEIYETKTPFGVMKIDNRKWRAENETTLGKVNQMLGWKNLPDEQSTGLRLLDFLYNGYVGRGEMTGRGEGTYGIEADETHWISEPGVGKTLPEKRDARLNARQVLMEMGYDGVDKRGQGYEHSYNDANEVIAFHPEQIKSATDNRGTFNPNDPRIVAGAAVRDMIPDFSSTGEFQDTKDNFEAQDPGTWPIDGEEATALKAQSGDPDNNEQVQALNEIIDKLGEDNWPKPVIDKAEEVRDALVAHLESNNERIEREGPAWQKVLDHPARDTAYNFNSEDTDTWPPKAQDAWNNLNLNDTKTWPAGLEAAAEKAGVVDHDDPETPEIDQDYAERWMADHVARPEWLKSVDKLPEGEQILNDRAQAQRDDEIQQETNRRMTGTPEDVARTKTLNDAAQLKESIRSEVAPDVPKDKFLIKMRSKQGEWEHRTTDQPNDQDGTPLSAAHNDRINPQQDEKNSALDAYWKKRGQVGKQVSDELASKPLRDYRKPLDGQDAQPEQATLFGAGVMDAPTDTNHSPKDGFAVENYREPDPAHEKHLLDELPSSERARAQIAEKFLGIPIKAAIDRIPLDSDIQKGAELLHNVKDQALKVLAPQVRTEQARLAGDLYSHRAAEYRLMRTQAIEAVKSARAMIDRKGKNALDFTLSIARAIESDTPHPDPEAREIVDLFTAVNNRFRDMVRSLPGTHFRNYIVDYFPHMFAERDQAKAAKFYERKLQGSTAFVKHRSIPTIQEAYEAGLHLKSDNAADLFLMKWDEMLRYKMGQDYLADLKENNLARPFDSDAAAPAGWSQVDSRIGKSTVSVPAHRDTPGAYEVKNSQVPLPGMPAEKKYGVDKAIHFYAPDSVAQVLNNHLAPGLSDYAWYKGSMMLANSLNQANLGFSAFHLGFVTCDSMISKQADAMESLIRDKDPVAAAKKLAQAYTPGVAPIMAYLSGSKLMKAALAPGTAESSELNAMIDAVTKGGGDVKRGEIYSNGWVQAMLQNWRKGTAIGYAQAGIRFPAALIEAAAHPILGHIVPRVKLGVFMDMARRELRRLGPDASHQATLKALQGAWASVDNRLGEFAYDNLHMHQGAKHVAFLAIRSVGWDLGTARELGLGTLDAARLGKNLISGKGSADDFTHRLAYTISLPMMLGAYGALATYLATGKAPQDIRDYFFPPTGEIDPYGHKMRFAPPTYGKDVAGFFHQPGQTLVNKLNPIWSNMFSIFQNRDFWGNQIYSPDDPAYKKGAAMLRYEAGAFEPFALSGYLQNRKMGVGIAKSVAPFFGLTPAASWIDKSPAEERAQELENRIHAGDTHTSEEAANYQKYLTLRNQFIQNDPVAGSTPDEKARAKQVLANPTASKDDQAQANKILARPDMPPEERTRRQQVISAMLQQGLRDGTIKPGKASEFVEAARTPPLLRSFQNIIREFQMKGDSRNAYLQAKSIWDLATPAERTVLAPRMAQVWGTARTRRETSDPKPVAPTAHAGNSTRNVPAMAQ